MEDRRNFYPGYMVSDVVDSVEDKEGLYYLPLHKEYSEGKERDPLMDAIPGKSSFSRFRRSTRRLFLLCKSLPCVPLIFRSRAALLHENTVHIRHHYYTIHPFSVFKICWTILVTLALAIGTMIGPLAVTYMDRFSNDVGSGFVIYSGFADLFSLLDIIMIFCSGRFTRQTASVSLNLKEVGRRYVSSLRFYVDIVTSLPLEIIYFYRIRNGNPPDVLMLITLSKFLRVLKVIANIYRISFCFRWNRFKTNLLIIILIAAYFCQFVACVFQMFHVMVVHGVLHGKVEESWMTLNSFVYEDVGLKYYFTLLGGIAIVIDGFGSKPPQSMEEMLMAILLFIMGFFVKTFIFCAIYKILRRNADFLFMERVEHVKSFMRSRRLIKPIQEKILRHYHCAPELMVSREERILYTINEPLLQKMVQVESRAILRETKIGKFLMEKIVTTFLFSATRELVLEHEMIMKPSDKSNSMFIVKSGELALYTASGRELCHVVDGDVFGEITLLLNLPLAGFYVVAVENSKLFHISKIKMLAFLKRFPELGDRLRQEAYENLQKLLDPDDLVRLYQDNFNEMALRASGESFYEDKNEMDTLKKVYFSNSLRKPAIDTKMLVVKPELPQNFGLTGVFDRKTQEELNIFELLGNSSIDVSSVIGLGGKIDETQLTNITNILKPKRKSKFGSVP